MNKADLIIALKEEAGLAKSDQEAMKYVEKNF